MSLVLGLVVLGVGAVSVWGGLTDPEGGVFAGIRNALAGTPNTKHVSTVAAGFLGDLTSVAGAAPGGTTPTAYTTGAPASGARAAIIATARTWLGVPYAWGGTSRAGVDCSGLVLQVYAANGIRLPRTSEGQQLAGHGVRLDHAQPADLIFFGIPAHHVGIYLGGGQLLHAPHSGTVVRMESVQSVAASLPGSPVTARDVLPAAPAHHAPAHARPHRGTVAT